MKQTRYIFALVLLVLTMSFSTFKEKKIIVIDAGHGGKDFGATVEENSEKLIAAAIAKKIKEMNQDENVSIVLLRDADAFVSLESRVETINALHPDLVISLHVNSNKNPQTNGVEAYVSENNATFGASKKHAELLLKGLSAHLKNRGEKMANFKLLRQLQSPAVLLQLGFLSNEKDREYITSEKGHDEIAAAIVHYIAK